MPIRFPCTHCGQLLGIASRKVGSEINCPKCGFAQVVPTPEAAEAALAMRRFARSAAQVESASPIVVYEEPPEAGAGAPGVAASASEASRAAGGSGDQGSAVRPLPDDLILYRRRTLYVHGVLFVLLFGIGLGAGYLIGRGNTRFEQQVQAEKQSRQRVLIEGRLVFDPGTGRLAGDEDAVVIALPESQRPEHLLSIQGIRPQDPAPDDTHRTIQAIHKLGGAYARADAEGGFSLIVPEGDYYLLIVSAHVRRSGQEPIDEAELLQMGEYFQLAEHLIGNHRYRWTLEKVNQGFDPIEINFSAEQEG